MLSEREGQIETRQEDLGDLVRYGFKEADKVINRAVGGVASLKPGWFCEFRWTDHARAYRMTQIKHDYEE